ncbi:hypothetical protein E1292_27125 [Nonomuraea deserti]|uniref:Inositol monophosphatase family protein n=1 Tax=Nonomuraea deserti TaxID=1848322 RepID=A0A4R4V7Q2_9ACTN|nr:inositol monophosphatase family protein [Nonomuraea deserti]TDD00982.1 hypothetical protein E1292_27125 [Nonomuraea deserti]
MTISDAEVARTAARAGADVVRAGFGTPQARMEKTGGDFATAADLESERAVLDVIRAARPGDAVIGEESGRTGAAGAERVWLVDPLCGTLNYAARTMLAAVNVALRVGRDVTVAASADPFAGEVFWTDGAHAFVWRAHAAEPPGNRRQLGAGACAGLLSRRPAGAGACAGLLSRRPAGAGRVRAS